MESQLLRRTENSKPQRKLPLLLSLGDQDGLDNQMEMKVVMENSLPADHDRKRG